MKRRSWTKKQLITAVKTSFSIREVLRKLNLVPAGGNYKQMHSYIKEYNIDASHFTGMAHLKGKTHNWSSKIPLEKILVVNSDYTSSNHLRKRLLRENVLQPKCSCCKRKTWLGKPISLELDHINGINTDNRLANLRLLCPNCHSCTDTYRGKNKGSA